MPESAELRIMSDFINTMSDGVEFHNIKKSEVSKVKTDLSLVEKLPVTIQAESRGKELFISLSDPLFTTPYETGLLVTMGMSGNWVAVHKESSIPKHSHLIFEGIHREGRDPVYLCLMDIRRFAKWSWKTGFSSNRGPCPVKENEKFKTNFYEKMKTDKKLSKTPLLDALMNQAFFNGIGNYLRAEIVHRAEVNPFQLMSTFTPDELEKILLWCQKCPIEAYQIGGGQMKDWKNSFNIEPQTFQDWRKVYGKGESLEDRGGRTFWYEAKWKESDEYKAYVGDI